MRAFRLADQFDGPWKAFSVGSLKVCLVGAASAADKTCGRWLRGGHFLYFNLSLAISFNLLFETFRLRCTRLDKKKLWRPTRNPTRAATFFHWSPHSQEAAPADRYVGGKTWRPLTTSQTYRTRWNSINISLQWKREKNGKQEAVWWRKQHTYLSFGGNFDWKTKRCRRLRCVSIELRRYLRNRRKQKTIGGMWCKHNGVTLMRLAGTCRCLTSWLDFAMKNRRRLGRNWWFGSRFWTI